MGAAGDTTGAGLGAAGEAATSAAGGGGLRGIRSNVVALFKTEVMAPVASPLPTVPLTTGAGLELGVGLGAGTTTGAGGVGTTAVLGLGATVEALGDEPGLSTLNLDQY